MAGTERFTIIREGGKDIPEGKPAENTYGNMLIIPYGHTINITCRSTGPADSEYRIEDQTAGIVYRTVTRAFIVRTEHPEGITFTSGTADTGVFGRPRPGRPGGGNARFYGCPMAEEVDGLVPDSMLTEFKGFSDIEL